MGGMIERKRGHVVAISSLLGRISYPFTITYGATKHGICGLMDSLKKELNFYQLDNYIKTTTVLPFFVKTRQDLVEKSANMTGNLPMISAENLAREVVDGVKRNRENLYVPGIIKSLLWGK